MKDYLVYVKKFIRKMNNDHIPEIQVGRVYNAVEEDGLMRVKLPSGDFIIDKVHQSGEVFDAEIIQITPENHGSFEYTPEDSEIVVKSIITPIIQKAHDDYSKNQERIVNEISEDIGELMLIDSEMLDAIAETTSYVRKNTSINDINKLDLSPISRGSYAGKGFNIGNGMLFLKRYLDRGKKSDLMKAQVSILEELIRLNNEQAQA